MDNNIIQKFKEFEENEDVIKKDDRIINYLVSYRKDSSRIVDMSIGSDDLLDLAIRLKNSFSETEFKSIFEIKIGSIFS